ncbi:plasmid stabilization protein [Methylococcaceae bacterium]|nr:plasmid stabilization protein [Methylococcaceae bacterium]
MNYNVTFTDTALKNLARYPAKDQQTILKNIKQLSENPLTKSNVKKLVDFGVSYRLRVGNYRVLFDREDSLKIIDVVDVLPRNKVYQRR